MKPWLLVVLGLALFTLAGCRTDPAIPLLERELYRKDREINRLRWEVEDLQELLNSGDAQGAPCNRPRDSRDADSPPRREHGGSNGPSVNVESLGPATKKVPKSLLPREKPSSPSSPEINIDVPGAPSDRSSNRDEGPALDGAADRVSSRSATGATAASLAVSAVPFNPSGDSRRVDSIQLDRMLTGGISTGDRSGDQGLLVVVEPRDQTGRLIDAPAEVSVAVLDPAFQGDAARVGRWDFTPAETASLFRRTGTGGAMHLAMAWPQEPPKHNKLHVFVRYTTADGRRIETNQPIEIALPGDEPARWTTAEPSRIDDSIPDRNPAPRAWPRDEVRDRRDADSPTYMATRTSETKPERPAWSPERR